MNILKLRILMLIDKFHKATDVAEALQVKQPTVSFHMKSLEKEMGTSLFSLQQGRIMLTEAGKNYYLTQSRSSLWSKKLDKL